ncbi:Methylmalonate-semialdehyde dehydrogenase [acylating] mitochondrial [Bienertia sinuspersici]
MVTRSVFNQATQEVVSQVPSTTYEEFKAAVVSAKEAFPSWHNTPIFTRQCMMIKLQELVLRDKEKLALIISTEQGKTVKSAHADICHWLGK